MTRVFIDFETYCAIDLKEVGLYKYLAHPSFHPWCLAYAVDNDEVKLWVKDAKFPYELVYVLGKEDTKIYAHNAEFEHGVLKKLGYDISLKQFVDTQALSAIFGYPLGLNKFCNAVGLSKGKDAKGTRLINKLCKPQNRTIKNTSGRWYPSTAPESFDDLYRYCIQDVEIMRQAVERLPTDELSPLEQYVWMHTVLQNERGVCIDIGSVKNIRYRLKDFRTMKERQFWIATSGNPEIEIVTGLTPRQTAKVKAFLNDLGLDIPNLAKETVDEYLDKDIPSKCRTILELRKQLAGSSTAKFDRMVQMCGEGNRVRGNLVYYGGHTGRFAGRGIQLHNLPRASVPNPEKVIEDFNTKPYNELLVSYPDMVNTASALIRAMITAPEGKKLVVADYSSVENVVLHWLAGDAQTTIDFRNGLCQYKVYSAARLGIPYDQVTKEQRAQSKPDVLGLGYGGGYRALISVAAGYGEKLSMSEAKDRVTFYRKKYRLIPKLWRNVFSKAKEAIITKEPQILLTPSSRLEFRCAGGYLFVLLPSGRRLSYPQVKLDAAWSIKVKGKAVRMSSEISYMGVKNNTWVRIGTHPGMLVENIIQALARDLLTYGLLCTEQAGFKIIASVHDEAIAECDESTENADEFCNFLCTRQKWSESIPLRADGYVSKRYKKE